MSNSRSFLRGLRRVVLLLFALAWGGAAYCGEIQDAARDGNLDKVKALVTANALLVSNKDQEGRTALHWAAANGHKDVVQFLLDHKADVLAKDNDGKTPLDLAIFHKDIAVLLHANGGAGKKTSSHDPAILEAARNGDLGKVKALVEDDPDEVFNKQPDLGATPLDYAAMGGHKDVVEYLLEHKSEIEHKNDENMTPLMDAAYNGHTDVVKLLLEKGANVNAADASDVLPGNKSGMTALHLAALKGYNEVAGVLLANKADANARNTYGETPLHIAMKEGWGGPEDGYKGVAESLLANGADINAQDGGGSTPLHVAAAGGRKAMVELLLAKGANINARDKKGRTALRVAMDGGVKDKDVADLLAKHGGAY